MGVEERGYQHLAGKQQEKRCADEAERRGHEVMLEQDRGAAEPKDRPGAVTDQRAELDEKAGTEARAGCAADRLGVDGPGHGGVGDAEDERGDGERLHVNLR